MSKKQETIKRIFEVIPGLLIWILLLSPVWAGLLFPEILINIFIVLSVYWVYRSTILTLGAIIGYIRYKQATKKNWSTEIQNLHKNELPDPALLPTDGSLFPNHLIVIANYGEEYDVLYRSIKAITEQNYPREKLYVAVSIEARKAKKDKEYAKRGEYLKRDFGDFFEHRLMFFVHPEDIPGEKVGAASNRTWGTRNAVIELEKQGLNLKDFLITAPDGDLVFNQQYLAACSHAWLLSEKRNNKFYQTALYTFNNNYWEVPVLIRILMMSITLPVLASSVFEKFKRETWSCFTLNLQLMKEVDYWDTSISVGADDTTFYWRPYFYLNGDWNCEVFYIPLSADAVYHQDYIQNHRDQYKQFLRWGWGVITVPIAVSQFIIHRNISIFEKVEKLIRLFEVFVFWKVLIFLITFGIPIVLFLNSDLNSLTISVTVPQTISTLLTISAILLIPNTLLKIKIIPKKPANMSTIMYYFYNIIDIPLLLIALFTFGTIPFIDASTRMMFGTKDRKVSWAQKELVK